jgi:hypothetical protein
VGGGELGRADHRHIMEKPCKHVPSECLPLRNCRIMLPLRLTNNLPKTVFI